ncbi:MAG: HAD family hydrolase [Dehalococcoidia bacterium]|nr:HAD family hydrolase [Dehalococcoidia bacterium]
MGTSDDSANAAVTFDLWQTLVFENDGTAISMVRREARSEQMVQRLSQFGVELELSVVRESFNSLSSEITAGHDDGYDAPYEDWIKILVERLAPELAEQIGSAEIAHIGKLVDQTFLDTPPKLLDGTKELLGELKKRGLKIGLISNTGLTSPQTYSKWFAQLGILDGFDFLAFSNGQSVAKPDAAIFEITLTNLGVDANRSLHVGDNMHTDVAGAAAVGMSTVWVCGGTNSPVVTNVEPNYSVDSAIELPAIVDEWLASLNSCPS